MRILKIAWRTTNDYWLKRIGLYGAYELMLDWAVRMVYSHLFIILKIEDLSPSRSMQCNFELHTKYIRFNWNVWFSMGCTLNASHWNKRDELGFGTTITTVLSGLVFGLIIQSKEFTLAILKIWLAVYFDCCFLWTGSISGVEQAGHRPKKQERQSRSNPTSLEINVP